MAQLVFARQTQDATASRAYSGERLINWFFRPAEGVSPGLLVCRSGLTALVSLSTSTMPSERAIKALLAGGEYLYAVSGGWLVQVAKDGTTTTLGHVGLGPVRMAWNGREIGLIVDGKYKLWDGTSIVEPVIGLLTCTDIVFQDGYFIISGANAERPDVITITGLYDGATVNALDIATAENQPDGLVGMVSDHGEVWLFGERSTEVWYNSGAADFPFQRNAGAIIEHGCLNRNTIAKADNAVFWVTEERLVARASSTEPQIISTRWIEERLKAETISSGFTVTDKGHKFYVVRCASGPALCFDLTTGLWSERSTGPDLGAWVATCSAFIWGDWYCGGPEGAIYRLDADTYTDDGEIIARQAKAQPVDTADQRFPVSRLGVQMQTGILDIGREPIITLETSRDGRNWSLSRQRGLGRLGEYEKPIEWNGLGTFRQFHARITVTDPVPCDVYGVTYG